MTNRNQTRFISPEEKAERLKAQRADAERNLLDQDPELYIARHTLGGHAFRSHVANSPRSLLNNVLSGQKHGDTKFRDAETQNYCMQEVLYNSMREIHNFVAKAQEGEQQLFAADFMDPDTGKPDFIGSGYVTTSSDKAHPYTGEHEVNYIESNLAAVVVKKNVNAPDGWEITTAFPMSHPRTDVITPSTSVMRPINKDFKDLLHQTMTYQKAGPVRKLAMDIKCANNRPNKRFSITYQAQSDRTPEQLIIKDNKTPNAPVIRITPNDPGTGLNLSLCSRNRPDMDLAKPESQQVARETVPVLYQHVLDIITASSRANSRNRNNRPRSPNNPGNPGSSGRNVSDMTIRENDSPDTGPNY